MLDASAYPALCVVRSHLRQRQRMVAPTASMNLTVVTAGPEFGVDLGRPISAVGEHIIAGVALNQQPIQLLAVVHGRIGHGILPDQLVLGVRVHMVFVAEELRPCFLVQRASRSFCRTLAGFCFHLAGVRPACSSAFSSRLFRCVGTGTILASMICPPRAM